jgi:gluconate 2-dehydrogenase gamma chain
VARKKEQKEIQEIQEKQETVNSSGKGITRRGFLARVGTLVTSGAVVGTVAGACSPSSSAGQAPTPTVAPVEALNTEVPLAPTTPPQAGTLRFFSPHEARTIEAITARIMPGTPDDPGAREAGVVNYIDYMLSAREGFNEPTYREAPFAELYETTPPLDSPYNVVWVSADQIDRYGYQSTLTPREVYRLGVGYLDAFARSRFNGRFADLTEDKQDELIGAMVDNTATGFDQFSAKAFFQVLRRHTGEGMFSDPAYGGNRDMIGWRLLGYTGAQRAWTPIEIKREGFRVEPQTLAEMPHFAPGDNAGNYVVQPVSDGSTDSEYGAFGPVDKHSHHHEPTRTGGQ